MNQDTKFEEKIIAANLASEEKEFWNLYYKEEFTKSVIPFDFNFKPGKNKLYNKINFRLHEIPSKKLIQISNNSDITIFIALLATLNVFLSKYLGLKDILLGTSIYRQDSNAKFINTVLPIRNSISEDSTFKDLLIKMKATIQSIYKHQNYPIEALINDLNISETEGFPLFDIVILFENIHSKEYVIHTSPNLFFLFTKNMDEIGLEIEYNSAAYKDETINYLGNAFNRVLDIVLSNIDVQVGNVQILSDEERNNILYAYNETNVDYNQGKTVQELFELQCKKNPNNIAVQSGDEKLTYKELKSKADQVVELINDSQVDSEIIAIISPHSIDLLAGIMGILKAGRAFLPIDPNLPANRIKYMLKDSNVSLVLTTKELSGSFSYINQQIILDNLSTNLNDDGTFIPNDIAYIIYTSGSTGMPKGTLIEQTGLINYLLWADKIYVKNEQVNFPLYTSISFDLTITSIFLPLISGNTIVIYQNVLEKDIIYQIIKDRKSGVIKATPSHLKILLNIIKKPDLISNTVKRFVLGGEILERELADSIYELFNGDVEIYNEYGPTEATVGCMTYKYSPSVDTKEKSVPIGSPADNMNIYILDSGQNPIPQGAIGEIYISGQGISRGYINKPELTTKSFLSSPFEENEKIYRTGDLGRFINSNTIQFIGRNDDQIKINGFRIELNEIKCRLLVDRRIKDALVTIKSFNETNVICAYYISDSKIEDSVLKDDFSKEMPDYMVPAFFIQIKNFPITLNGKIDIRSLPDPEIQFDTSYIPAENPTQIKLVEIWANVLQLQEESISIYANFFELGGHSLSAAVLLSKIHANFEVQISLAEIFQNPNIKKLSEYIQDADKEIHFSIKPTEKREYYPVSPAQQRMYFLMQLDTKAVNYNIQYIMHLENVNMEEFSNAVNTIMSRHDSLRTRFRFIGNELVQEVTDSAKIEIEDYTIEKGETPKILKDFVRPFDLSKSPLIRIGLVQVKGEIPIILIDMHHIITDMVSMNVIEEEFNSLLINKQLPKLNIQYKDFTKWQANSNHQQNDSNPENYWLNLFNKGDIPVLELPLDYQRPVKQSFEGASINFSLNNKETRRLKEIARSNDVTLFMLILAIYNIFLSKITNQEDIIIGSPVAGRPHEDLQKVIGLFVNTLALRNVINPNKRFNEFLQEIKNNTLQSLKNQDYQFENLVNKLKLNRDTSRNPIFDVMYNMITVNDDNKKSSAVEDTFTHFPSVSKFDLTLTSTIFNDEIIFSFQYCTSLFKSSTIDSFIGYFRKIIDEILANQKILISQIQILNDYEIQYQLKAFNETANPYPKTKTIIELFEEQVVKVPINVALVDGDNRMTYKELNERANRIAVTLQKEGVSNKDIVGVFMDRSSNLIISILGILKAGGCYLPIDINLPEERIKYILKDSQSKKLITTTKYAPVFSKIQPAKGFPQLEILYIDNSDGYDSNISDLKKTPSPNDPAYIIYTSGTTGNPKGVLVENQSLVNYLTFANRTYLKGEKVNFPFYTSVSFDLTITSLFSPLITGNTIIIYPDTSQKSILEIIIEDNNIQILKTTPSHLQLLKDYLLQRESNTFTSVKRLIVGGEVLTSQLANDIFKLFDNQIEIYNEYGPTEATVGCMIHKYNYDKDNQLSVPIGVPADNTQIYLLDKFLNPVPNGTIGEIYISGDCLARGYLNDPLLSDDKFINNPFVSEHKMYHSGDLAKRLPNGNLEFIGRVDDQVKIRGYRIELGEIEEKIRNYIEDFSVSVDTQEVDGILDESDYNNPLKIENVIVTFNHVDEINKFLCAYYVSNRKVEKQKLKHDLKNTLPEYMIPNYFVQLEEFKLTPNGKIDKNSLPQAEIELTTNYVPPSNEFEEILVNFYSEILSKPKDEISIHANFFDLGGNSLTLLILLNRLNNAFHTELSVTQFFAHPTIYSIIQYIKGSGDNLTKVIDKIEESVETRNEIFRILDEPKA